MQNLTKLTLIIETSQVFANSYIRGEAHPLWKNEQTYFQLLCWTEIAVGFILWMFLLG
jgi:hypothetical protein